MSIKYSFIAILLLVSCHSFSQLKNAEIGIITDNDLYTSSKYDMYYTNGLELFYKRLILNNSDKIQKQTVEFKVGQYIYTPRFINTPEKEIMDRPYAGYLFGEVGSSLFYKNESVVKVDFRLGYLGPNSFGRETQRSFHDLVGYKQVFGWEFQIQNALALQAHAVYSKKMFPNRSSDFVDLHFKSEASVGTIFTGASTGLVSRIGFKKLAPIYDSNLYGGAVGSSVSEFYFYIAPSINFQVYDATIQGSLFNNNSPVTFKLVPWRFNGEAGFKYRKNNLNLSYIFMYRGRELHHPTNSGYFYGSIGLSYLL
jgi:lipid A 3-O-deacylase